MSNLNLLPMSKRISKNLFRFILFTTFVFLLSIIPYPNFYFSEIPKTKGITVYGNKKYDSPPLYPVKITKEDPPVISAEGIFIQDLKAGVVIYSKNSDMRLSPASTTKIVTALVALDKFKLDDILTVQTVINEGKTMGLVKNEQLTLESLLYGILVHSANDAAYTIAENYHGGVSEFVKLMNDKAKKLGLKNTHFTNSIGFDDKEQYSTASELAKQAVVGLSNKEFTKIVGTKSITVSDVSYTYFHSLTNVNELLGKVPGISGVKTGYTQSAGEVLISEVKKNGQAVIFVILKSNDRFGETIKLVNWVFNNFDWEEINKINPTMQVK